MAESIPNIFYKLKKLKIKQIQMCLHLSKGNKYIAGDLKSDDYVIKLIHQDEGFRVSRNLGGLSYFENCKKDLFAMLHQLDNPT